MKQSVAISTEFRNIPKLEDVQFELSSNDEVIMKQKLDLLKKAINIDTTGKVM